MYTKLLLFAFGTLIASSAAHSADFIQPTPQVAPAPVVSPARWNGFYLGAVGAYGWADTKATLNGPIYGDGVDINANGGLLGATVGYNWQVNNWVLGVEGDISAGDIGGNNSLTTFFTTTGQYDINWLGTVRGRVGWSTSMWGNPTLLYVTGGAAWAGGERHITNPFNDNVKTSATHTGWTVGVGAEYAINNRWSLKGEYLYTDLGTQDYVGGFPNNSEVSRVSVKANLFRLGVNFKF